MSDIKNLRDCGSHHRPHEITCTIHPRKGKHRKLTISPSELDVKQGDWLSFRFKSKDPKLVIGADWCALATFGQSTPKAEKCGCPIWPGGEGFPYEARHMGHDGSSEGGWSGVQVIMLSVNCCVLQISQQVKDSGWKFNVTWLDFDESHAFIAGDDPCMKIGGVSC